MRSSPSAVNASIESSSISGVTMAELQYVWLDVDPVRRFLSELSLS